MTVEIISWSISTKVWDRAGIELATPGSAVRHASKSVCFQIESNSHLWKTRTSILRQNNYNCHNIYWDPLIWLVKNGHLIALTCISIFNEPGPYSWGAGPFTTELLLWYCTMLLWREMDSLQLLTLYLALTPIFSGRKAKVNIHTTPKLTVVIPISCLLP